ncbi:hypothetical protein CDD81_7088 [Ophiocordyceps australis]|uniref:C2H2-type domain-containing protein n=1 Tax=Ophiocordyceps australis TaxID=1399860 RepID=A0A2C5XZ30_9HYPO|nr:hypothetical protein CDD81_7088 [Ophiocordyceps australis]
MLPIHHPLEAEPRHQAAASLLRAQPGQTRDQKPKTLPCRYCNKQFRRVEHVQRHERTHTKEKPFSCAWDRCGKTFGRRDLLVRHEKLVHLNDGSKENNRPRTSSSSTTAHHYVVSDKHATNTRLGLLRLTSEQAEPTPNPLNPQLLDQTPQQQAPLKSEHHHQQGQPPCLEPYHAKANTAPATTRLAASHVRSQSRSASCNLEVLSNAALATQVNSMPHMMQGVSNSPPEAAQGREHGGPAAPGYANRPRLDQQCGLPSNLMPHAPPATYDHYNLFLDEFARPPHLLASQLDGEEHTSPRLHQHRPSYRLQSRLGSLAPDFREPLDPIARPLEETVRPSSLRVSAMDHHGIKNRVGEFFTVLPGDFVFPSRHTLSRFIDGYIGGFHDHVPLLHLPTLTPIEMAPELLLAILAVGAQCRFESTRGYALWYAARAVAMEQIRRRHSSEIHALLPTAAAYSPHSTRPSPSTSYRHSFASAQSERPATQDTHREPYSSNTLQARLETIQAVLLLFTFGLWGAKTILQDALSVQSTLAMLIREEGLSVDSNQTMVTEWEAWVRLEGAKRTKLIAYCFFNLCSTAYDTPPLVMTSELNLDLPSRSRLWRAETAWQWHELRQSTPVADMTVKQALGRLFGRTGMGLPSSLSSLGHGILMHALIQHIYLLKQTLFETDTAYEAPRRLREGDVEEVTQALRMWKASFESRRQVRAAETGGLGGSDCMAGGSLSHNGTALLRLAYLRLNSNLPWRRQLETRDSVMIATALDSAPLLERTRRLDLAVMQAVHALSMLVRAGVKYVARAKSTEWSIEHSLCNFESALVLAKWLLTLAAIAPSEAPASSEEKELLGAVRQMLDETEFAVPIDPSLSWPECRAEAGDGAKVRQLASAVVRLWAETFKGTHILELVKVMGASLDGYADLVDKWAEGRHRHGI